MEMTVKPVAVDTQLPRKFLKHVRKRQAAKTAGRIDLQQRYTFSIDKPGTRVIDDAISISRSAGTWRLDVHVADVATWCVPDSTLDRIVNRCVLQEEHRNRLMLPMNAVKGGLSLDAGKSRLAITVSMWFDATATRFATHVYRSIVQCDTNTNFADADAMNCDTALADTTAKRRLMPKLNMLRSLGTGLAKRQLAHGRLPIDPENSLPSKFDQLIETVMLETGFAIAEVCKIYKAEVWYRTQAQPSPNQWRDLRGYFADRLIELPYRPDAHTLAMAMEKVMSDETVGDECRQLCLRNTQAAADVIVAKEHFALGQRLYVQATSPLRLLRNLHNQQAIRQAILNFGGPLCLGVSQ